MDLECRLKDAVFGEHPHSLAKLPKIEDHAAIARKTPAPLTTKKMLPCGQKYRVPKKNWLGKRKNRPIPAIHLWSLGLEFFLTRAFSVLGTRVAPARRFQLSLQ